MRSDDMKRIARATSAGFAMPITAQFDDEMDPEWDREDTPSRPDRDWATRMLEDLRNDEDVFQQAQNVGEENVVPTDEQRSKIDQLNQMFPDVMDFSSPDFEEEGEPDDISAPDFDDLGGDFEDDRLPPDLVASNSARLIRLAVHLDSLGLHDLADDLDTAAEEEIRSALDLVGKPGGIIRSAQAQLAEVGIDEDDIDLETQDDQSQVVSFDPDRENMIVKDPRGVYKLYSVTGTSETGKPRFELVKVLDSPDERIADLSEKLMGPPTIDLGNAPRPNRRVNDYSSQLMGGNPSIQQAYA